MYFTGPEHFLPVLLGYCFYMFLILKFTAKNMPAFFSRLIVRFVFRVRSRIHNSGSRSGPEPKGLWIPKKVEHYTIPVKRAILKELGLTSLVPPICSSSSSLCSPLIFSSRSSTSSFIAYTQRRINYYLILFSNRQSLLREIKDTLPLK